MALYTSDTLTSSTTFRNTLQSLTKKGSDSITNLTPGKYKLYAFEDKNKNLKAETRTEKFGFLAKPIESTVS